MINSSVGMSGHKSFPNHKNTLSQRVIEAISQNPIGNIEQFPLLNTLLFLLKDHSINSQITSNLKEKCIATIEFNLQTKGSSSKKLSIEQQRLVSAVIEGYTVHSGNAPHTAYNRLLTSKALLNELDEASLNPDMVIQHLKLKNDGSSFQALSTFNPNSQQGISSKDRFEHTTNSAKLLPLPTTNYPVITKNASNHSVSIPSTEAASTEYLNPLVNINVNTLNQDQVLERKRVLNEFIDIAPRKVKSRIFGQSDQIDEINTKFKNAIFNLNAKSKHSPNAPASIVFLMGPSGTGKTESVKEFAEAYGRELIPAINMNLFKDSQMGINLLTGSGPAFEGKNAETVLLKIDKAIKRSEAKRTYPPILFLDEFEKAHPDVHEALMQFFETGELTNNTDGSTLKAPGLMIFMASNLCEKDLTEAKKKNPNMNYKAYKELSQELVEKKQTKISGAIIGRLKNVIPFNPISKDSARQILQRLIEEHSRELLSNPWFGFKYKLTNDAKEQILEKGVSLETGARKLKSEYETIIASLEALSNECNQKNIIVKDALVKYDPREKKFKAERWK